jgi:mannose-6-phosphate isomerase-like protein (cupin superfamily)
LNRVCFGRCFAPPAVEAEEDGVAAIVSDASAGMSELIGVHGGAGELGWKRLGTGNMMFTDVDSFEIAVLPPGARAGRHRHSRTEELFFVLGGRARIGLGDDVVEVGPGDAILTGFMGLQSVEAIGDEPYRMLVIEALPPEIAALLPDHDPTEEHA